MKRLTGYAMIFLALYVPFSLAGFSVDISTYLFASTYLVACEIYREAIR